MGFLRKFNFGLSNLVFFPPHQHITVPIPKAFEFLPFFSLSPPDLASVHFPRGETVLFIPKQSSSSPPIGPTFDFPDYFPLPNCSFHLSRKLIKSCLGRSQGSGIVVEQFAKVEQSHKFDFPTLLPTFHRVSV